jgi:hypothetical protein
VEERREPFAERDRLFAVEQRHQLAVAPHVRLAAVERVARPRARASRIVAGQQRRAARAQEVRSRGFSVGAPHGTEHSR